VTVPVRRRASRHLSFIHRLSFVGDRWSNPAGPISFSLDLS
jgi:hypothetical protein